MQISKKSCRTFLKKVKIISLLIIIWLETVTFNNAAIPLSVLAISTVTSHSKSYEDVAFRITYKLLNG